MKLGSEQPPEEQAVCICVIRPIRHYYSRQRPQDQDHLGEHLRSVVDVPMYLDQGRVP